MHSSFNMPRALPIAGFSLLIIQEASSSNISVAPTCRKLKPAIAVANRRLLGPLVTMAKLGFSAAESDTALSRTAPRNCSTIQAKEIACHRFTRVRVCSKIAVYPARQLVKTLFSRITICTAPSLVSKESY
jgi:hypothetical protein